MENNAETELAAEQKTKRKKAFGIFFFILIITTALTALYWFFFLKDYQSTEDAYVNGNQVMISSQVAGNVRQINVENMDFVHAGDVLLELDDTDYQLSFSQAQNTLAGAVRQISQLGYTVKQLEATVQANQTALTKAQGDLARREQLGKSGAIDKESLQHAREAVMTAEANLKAVKNQLAANKSLLMNVPLKEQPEIQKAISSVKQAWLNLQRTKITSPIDGYVARRSTQVGQKVAVGSALMAVIANDQMWVDANFKETQLKDMRIGQPVKLSFDLYGHDVKFDGKIEGIEMGTGSAFYLVARQHPPLFAAGLGRLEVLAGAVVACPCVGAFIFQMQPLRGVVRAQAHIHPMAIAAVMGAHVAAQQGLAVRIGKAWRSGLHLDAAANAVEIGRAHV